MHKHSYWTKVDKLSFQRGRIYLDLYNKKHYLTLKCLSSLVRTFHCYFVFQSMKPIRSYHKLKILYLLWWTTTYIEIRFRNTLFIIATDVGAIATKCSRFNNLKTLYPAWSIELNGVQQDNMSWNDFEVGVLNISWFIILWLTYFLKRHTSNFCPT